MPGTKFKPFSLYGEPERPATPFKPFSLFDDEGAAQAAPKTVFRPFSLDDSSAGASAFNNQPVLDTVKNLGLGAANLMGTVLQPVQGVQAALVTAPLALLQGKPHQSLDALKAAAGYVTYGAAEYIPGFEKARTKAPTGFDLAKNIGMPDQYAGIFGFAYDVLADPANLLAGAGVVSKAAGASKLATSLFKASDVATRLPLPVRDIVRALPEETRASIAGGISRSFLGAERDVPAFARGPGTPVRTTILEAFTPGDVLKRMVPQKYAAFIDQQTSARLESERFLNELGQRGDEMWNAFQTAFKGHGEATVKQGRVILSRLSDASKPQDFEQAFSDLQQLAVRANDPKLVDAALTAVGIGAKLDMWLGGNLVRVGQFTPDALRPTFEASGAKLAFIKAEQQAPGSGLASLQAATAAGKQAKRDPFLFPDNAIRGSVRRMFALFGEHPDAHLARISAQGVTPTFQVTDPARLEASIARAWTTAPVAPVDVAKTITGTFQANPNATLGDALIAARTTHNLSEDDFLNLINSINDDLPAAGVKLTRQSSQGQAFGIRSRLELEQQGYGASGQNSVKAGRLGPRQDLSAQTLGDYGEIQDFLAQYSEQARIVGHSVVAKQSLLSMRAFLAENGLYHPQLTQRIEAGKVDATLLPKELQSENIPVNRVGQGISGVQKPGMRTLNSQDVAGFEDVFQAGDVVPDFAWRALTVGKKAGGAVAATTWQRLVNVWKAVKIGNPSTYMINFFSNIVTSDMYGQHGINPARLTAGMWEAARPSAKLKKELDDLSWSTQLNSDIRRADARRALAEQAGASDLPSGMAGALEYVLRGLETVSGANPNALGTGRAAKVARYGTPLNFFGLGPTILEAHSNTEKFMKASVYAAARKAGKSIDESAEIARLALFDYDSAPLAVQFAARSGIEPFGRYRALSTWRLLTNLYDAPARTARYYRVPDAAVNNFAPEMEGERQKTAMQGMDYLLKKLPYPLFEDAEGRTWWSPLMSIMPEGAAVDMISDANSTNFLGVVPIPPLAQLAMSVFAGVGFRGRNPYEGLVERGGFFEASHADPVEAGRRAVKEIWRFVAYPWAAGSVTSEQLAKAIAANARSEDDLAREAGLESGREFREKALRLLADGPFAVGYGEGALPLTAATAYSEPPTPLPLAAARFVGLKSYPVQPDPGKLGSANRLIFEEQSDLQAKVEYLEKLLTNAKLNGMSDAAWEAFRRSRIPELQRMKARLQELAGKLKGSE